MEYSIVVGATGFIGKEIVFSLLRNGENLILVGRNPSKLTILKQNIDENFKNANVLCLNCDLTSLEDVKKVFLQIQNLNVRIKGLYFTAGVDTQKPFIDFLPDKISMQARVNFESALLFSNFALKNKAENLKILIVSSITGILPMPYFLEYSATKSALICFFTGLRKEVDKSVKITILAPGSVPTRLDVIEDIKKQGLTGKLSSKPASYVVKCALKTLNKNKRLCVPGFYNKIVYFFNKITPYSISSRIISKKFKNKQKDAF